MWWLALCDTRLTVLAQVGPQKAILLSCSCVLLGRFVDRKIGITSNTQISWNYVSVESGKRRLSTSILTAARWSTSIAGFQCGPREGLEKEGKASRRSLRHRAAVVVGGGLCPSHGFPPSRLNVADDPSRHRDGPLPSWLQNAPTGRLNFLLSLSPCAGALRGMGTLGLARLDLGYFVVSVILCGWLRTQKEEDKTKGFECEVPGAQIQKRQGLLAAAVRGHRRWEHTRLPRDEFGEIPRGRPVCQQTSSRREPRLHSFDRFLHEEADRNCSPGAHRIPRLKNTVGSCSEGRPYSTWQTFPQG